MIRIRKDKEHRLGRLPLFEACSPAQLRAVASAVDEVDVEAGTVLAAEGHLAREFLVIASGQASAWQDGTKVGDLASGDRVGDTELITGQPITRTIVTETFCRLVVADARRFYALVEQVPPVARHLLKDHAQRSREANDRTYGKVVTLPALRMRPATA